MSLYYQDDLVTLFLGNCLEETAWLDADVLVTDPPYGIVGGRLSSHKGVQVHADVAWDDLDIRDDALKIWGNKPALVFGSPKASDRAPAYRGVPLIWDKGNSPGMGDYTWPFGASYELIWVSGDGWAGTRRSSVFRSIHSTQSASLVGHPTPKPVGLMESLISYAPAGVVADPFAGSGATLIAARNLGRQSIAVEIEERYCELIAKRLAQQAFNFGEPTE